MGKYFICLLAYLVIGMKIAFADVEHTVVRGETIESIANKYKISQEALIKANPDIESLFYVGMRINIPSDEVKIRPASDEVSSFNDSIINNLDDRRIGNEVKAAVRNGKYLDEQPVPGLEMAIRLSYGFIPKPKGLSQSPWAYAATIGANYWFINKLSGPFASVMIGYDSASLSSYTFDVETKTSCHFISVPISAGYALSIINKKFALTPYIGFSPKFCVKASGESKAYGEIIKYDGKKKFSMDFSYGAALRIMGFNIIGTFSAPLNDAQKGYFGNKPYFNLGIGFGF